MSNDLFIAIVVSLLFLRTWYRLWRAEQTVALILNLLEDNTEQIRDLRRRQ